MNRITFVGCWVFLSAGILPGQSLPHEHAGFPVQYRPGGTPFTATIVTRKYGPDGNIAGQEHITYSVRSDKSTSKSIRRFTGAGKMVANTTLLHDSGRNLEIVVEHFTQSTHHGLRPDRDNDNFPVPDLTSRAIDASTLLGYPVFKIEARRSSPDEGEMVQENWIAPELDNFPLRTTTTWKLGGATLRTETEATSIVPDALPQESFQVPEGYIERTPSEQAELLMAQLGWPQISPNQTSEWDRRYFQRLPANMASLVRSRPTPDTSRLPGPRGEGGWAPIVPSKVPVNTGEDVGTGPSEGFLGSGRSPWIRLLVLAGCLIVGSGVVLMRRSYLRTREPRA